MSIETAVRIIELIIAPVVMITACAIMQNGLTARYSSLGERLRIVNQEKLSLLEADLSNNQLRFERLQDLEKFLPELLHHHHLVHNALAMVYYAILTFMLSMLVIALAEFTNAEWLRSLIIVVFLVGIGILCRAMTVITHELQISHKLAQLDVHHTCPSCRLLHHTPHKR